MDGADGVVGVAGHFNETVLDLLYTAVRTSSGMSSSATSFVCVRN